MGRRSGFRCGTDLRTIQPLLGHGDLENYCELWDLVNSGRGILDGPGRQNINLSLLKRFNVGERKFVQLRWETFNIFNHPNFLLPNRNFNETAAGVLGDVVSGGQGGPRTMQFALRYEF